MQDATLITPAEYAPSRGLAKSTISRQVRQGKIPMHGGLIDPAEADEARKNNLDMSRRPHPPAERDAAAVEDLAGISGSACEILIHARAARELTAAKEGELSLKKRQGELWLNAKDETFRACGLPKRHRRHCKDLQGSAWERIALCVPFSCAGLRR